MIMEARQARIVMVEQALELLAIAQDLARKSENFDRYLRATRDRVAELAIPANPSSLAWDAAYQQRSEILWIIDKALHGCMWDWDRDALQWISLQLELRLASLLFPPTVKERTDRDEASAA